MMMLKLALSAFISTGKANLLLGGHATTSRIYPTTSLLAANDGNIDCSPNYYHSDTDPYPTSPPWVSIGMT